MTKDEAELRAEQLTMLLRSLTNGEIVYQAETDSTNNDAFAGAIRGANDLSIYAAYAQRAGRGRMERKWETCPGGSLAVSFLIQPHPDEMDCLNLFSPLMGLAAAAAIERCTPLHPQVKWPNDILVHRRKVSGILCEMRWQGTTLLGPVLGIGINLKKGSAPVTPNIVYPATSLEDECGTAPEGFVLIKEILCELLRLRPQLGKESFFTEWNERLAYRNETVSIIAPGKKPQAMTVRGIAPNGDLLTEDKFGNIRSFTAGEITLRPTI